MHFERDVYVEDSDILGNEAFKQLVKAFFDAKRNGLTECCLVKIQHTADNFKEIAQKLEKKLRQTDYFGVTFRWSLCVAAKYRR